MDGVVQLEMAYRLKTKVSSAWSSSIGNGLPTEQRLVVDGVVQWLTD